MIFIINFAVLTTEINDRMDYYVNLCIFSFLTLLLIFYFIKHIDRIPKHLFSHCHIKIIFTTFLLYNNKNRCQMNRQKEQMHGFMLF